MKLQSFTRFSRIVFTHTAAAFWDGHGRGRLSEPLPVTPSSIESFCEEGAEAQPAKDDERISPRSRARMRECVFFQDSTPRLSVDVARR